MPLARHWISPLILNGTVDIDPWSQSIELTILSSDTVVYSEHRPALNTLIFFKVKSLGSSKHPVKDIWLLKRKGVASSVDAVRRTGRPGPRFNYKLLKCNNLIYTFEAGITTAAGLALRGLDNRIEALSRPHLMGASAGLVLLDRYGTSLKPIPEGSADTFCALHGSRVGAPLRVDRPSEARLISSFYERNFYIRSLCGFR